MQTQKARPRPTTSQTEESSAPQPSTEATDELLDEIDGVLEEQAEEFIKAYVQKGGQ
jgi:ubiquitin-like protein Pup